MKAEGAGACDLKGVRPHSLEAGDCRRVHGASPTAAYRQAARTGDV
jgi:hypothetical protein